MKRFVSVLTLIVAMTLIFSSCSSTANTGKDEDYLYSIGEKIEIYDNSSEAKLGEVTITDVIVLSEEAFRLQVSEENSVYCEGIVQICYTSSVVDSSNAFNYGNFTVRDCEGEDAIRNPEVEFEAVKTEDQYFVCAVENLGEGLKIGVQFHSFQPIIAWVDASYEAASDYREENPPAVNNDKADEEKEPESGKVKLLTFICFAEGVALAGAIVTILILVTKKKI